jgi:hypothetical protein
MPYVPPPINTMVTDGTAFSPFWTTIRGGTDC